MNAWLSSLSLAAGSPEPIYRQLIEQVRRRIAAGQLKPGEEMPSVREVAQQLAVNPMTVSKAYAQLEAQGALVRRRGQAMVVADTQAEATGEAAVPSPQELLRPTLARAAVEARQLGLTDAQALALFKTELTATAQPANNPGDPS